MLLLLARHGNTFNEGDKVVWAGARTDLPLTGKGKEQAEALAAGLQPVKGRTKRVISGPLKRTREYVEIAARLLELEAGIEVDGRLREIDYGLWEGKSTGEIEALGAGAELRAWNGHGAWPRTPGWNPPAETIAANVAQLAAECAGTLGEDGAALLVTSNGVLKFFPKLVPGAFEEMAARGVLKVATGHCCGLRHGPRGWQVLFWDRAPAQLEF